jgi:hypothetical protein
MSNKIGQVGRHRFHGDPKRFETLAYFIAQNYFGKVKRIADVAGGQGMLARILKKKYNFDVEVIDPRGNTLVGVESRKEKYSAEIADYYDLIVGLHPDSALQEVVLSALVRPTVVIPCCNFWDQTKVLGTEDLLEEIKKFYDKNGVKYEEVTFDFAGPKNIGLVTTPPQS